MTGTLGIDVACRAEHQATLAIDGKLAWRGRKFLTRTTDLDRLWADLEVTDPAALVVVLEPTCNAWLVLAQWFRRRGARVVMVPTTQSATGAGTTPSTPRTTASIPRCWRSCRCCTLKD